MASNLSPVQQVKVLLMKGDFAAAESLAERDPEAKVVFHNMMKKASDLLSKHPKDCLFHPERIKSASVTGFDSAPRSRCLSHLKLLIADTEENSTRGERLTQAELFDAISHFRMADRDSEEGTLRYWLYDQLLLPRMMWLDFRTGVNDREGPPLCDRSIGSFLLLASRVFHIADSYAENRLYGEGERLLSEQEVVKAFASAVGRRCARMLVGFRRRYLNGEDAEKTSIVGTHWLQNDQRTIDNLCRQPGELLHPSAWKMAELARSEVHCSLITQNELMKEGSKSTTVVLRPGDHLTESSFRCSQFSHLLGIYPLDFHFAEFSFEHQLFVRNSLEPSATRRSLRVELQCDLMQAVIKSGGRRQEDLDEIDRDPRTVHSIIVRKIDEQVSDNIEGEAPAVAVREAMPQLLEFFGRLDDNDAFVQWIGIYKFETRRSDPVVQKELDLGRKFIHLKELTVEEAPPEFPNKFFVSGRPILDEEDLEELKKAVLPPEDTHRSVSEQGYSHSGTQLAAAHSDEGSSGEELEEYWEDEEEEDEEEDEIFDVMM